ncbi:type IV pilus modification protein PilV [uncultured Ramlibacter sp.]|uniref:type IV pilus modification protein PilV n=1 Tax=uncultured Ramlibacter sp. TaxID=260755 RepID=UPI0026141383|nr:type IV pilus modification protein PilV [uncultured Ramlibacter sp.]
MTAFRRSLSREAGSSLIEVLIAILVLSFGMLGLSGMLAFAVQAPKLSGNRATAANLASSHVERIRANPAGFSGGNYAKPLTYDETFNSISVTACAYPNCTVSSLADMDHGETARAIRLALPAGGMLMSCDPSPCNETSYGNLWVIWQEPATSATLSGANSDNCPAAVASFVNPVPRCLYVRFKP